MEPEIYILPDEKLDLLPRNQIMDEASLRAQYSVVDASSGTVFDRHFGSNRISGKVSSNVTEIKPLCEEEADFLYTFRPLEVKKKMIFGWIWQVHRYALIVCHILYMIYRLYYTVCGLMVF